MDLENKIKNHLKDASSLEGVDVNDLWNNIEKGLEEKKEERKTFLFKKHYLLGGLIFLFTTGGISWSLFYNHPNGLENYQPTINTTKNNQHSKHHIELADNSLSNDNSLTPPSITKNNQKANNTNFNHHIELADNSLSNDNPLTPPSITKNNQKANNTDSNHHTSIIDNGNWNKYDIKSNKKIKPLNLQDLSIELPLSSEQKYIDPNVSNPFSINNKGNKTRFSVGAFVGLHTMKNTFFTPSNSDNISDLLNKGYQYELGSSIGLEVDFRFYKSLFVSTGLEYNQSMNEFNLTRTWGITIPNPSSPTGYSNAMATRIVKHHNKMSYCAIPLLLGIKKSTGRLEWGVSLGVHFNFTQSQTGKTLDQYDNVVVLNERTTAFPVSRFFISYTCRPFINYRINNNITIQLRVDGRYQNYGFSDLYQLNHAAIYMGLSIGAQFKF